MSRRPAPSQKPRRDPFDQRACQAKRSYPSKMLAEQAAEISMLRDFHLELDVYKCPFGSHWHLTRRSPI